MKMLTTDRLNLRQWDLEDADFVFDLYSRWQVQRFIGLVPRVMEDRAEATERISAWRGLEHPINGIWAVEIAATEQSIAQLVGTLLLKSIPASGETMPLEPSGDTEIGWHFHPEYWGNGYATEAAAAVLTHAFRNGLKKVVAVTNPENHASQKVCRRIGMTDSGLTADYYNATCELFVAKKRDPDAARP